MAGRSLWEAELRICDVIHGRSVTVAGAESGSGRPDGSQLFECCGDVLVALYGLELDDYLRLFLTESVVNGERGIFMETPASDIMI